MKMKNHFCRMLPALMLCLIFSGSASIKTVQAQEVQDQGFSAGSSITFDNDSLTGVAEDEEAVYINKEISSETEATIMEDDEASLYLSPTVENLSKLYWKKDILSLENDKAIDNFLFINECEIYKKFYNDDFEWSRIRAAARTMLEENKESFSERYKLVIPLDLGRYDLERQGFPLVSDTAFKDLRRVEVGGNNRSDICGTREQIRFYPRNFVLILSRPYNLSFLEVDEHIAQAFLIRRKYNPVNVDETGTGENYNRPVFARMRFKLTNYQGQAQGRNNTPLAVLFGEIEGIDIFEDSNENNLLASIDYRE